MSSTITRKKHLRINELSSLLRDEETRHLALLYVKDNIATTKQSATLEQYAALLPRDLPSIPEEQLLLAELYLELWPWNRARFLPRWRERATIEVVKVAWCQTEFIVDPVTLGVWGEQELIYQALDSLRPAEVIYPKELLTEMLRLPRFQRRALALLPLFIQSCALLPEEAVSLLCFALQAKTAFTDEVFALLSMPWARVMPCRPELKRALQETSSLRGLACASAWGLPEPLFHALSQEHPRASQRQALSLIGEHAQRHDLSTLIGHAQKDPAGLGEALFTSLRALHRRGIFLRDEHAPALLFIFFSNNKISARDFTRITFTSRREIVSQLEALSPDEPAWSRAAPLLVELTLGPQGDKLPIPALLIAKLQASQKKAIFLQALSQLEDSAIEDAALPLLVEDPAPVLSVLARSGGEATKATLRKLLGLSGEAHPAMYAAFAPALSLLWRLSSFEEKCELIPRLEPTQLPPVLQQELRQLQLPEARLLLRHHQLGSHEIKSREYLIQAARFGDEEDWALLQNLLMRLVTEIAAGETPNEAERGEERQTISSSVIEALKEYGRRLFTRGRIRPTFVLDAKSESEAGTEAVVSICLELLQRRDLSIEETEVLLRALRPLQSPKIFAGVYPFLREEEPHLRKLVLFLLAKDGAEILSANLSALVEVSDIQTVRQALAALGKSRASWAIASIVGCLSHQNMNIKKVAAEAIAEALTPEAAPAVLSWLSRQDNPGFRDLLVSSLSHCLQDYFVPTLLAAAQAGEDPRHQELLLRALSGRLKIDIVRRAVQRQHPVSSLLLSLLQRGALSVHPGSLEDLWSEFERIGLPLELQREQETILHKEVSQLQERGWSPDLAATIVKYDEWSKAELEIVRKFLLEWLGQLKTSPGEAQPDYLRLLASLDPLTEQEQKIFAAHVDVLLLGLSHHGAPYQERCLRRLEAVSGKLHPADGLRVVARLRQLHQGSAAPLPKGQQSYLSLLKVCGAIWTRADVKVALSRCLIGYDHRGEVIRTLAEAFGPYDKKSVPEPLREHLASCVAAGVMPERSKGATLVRGVQPPASRPLMSGLFEIFADATPQMREMLLDWLEELQPLGASPWVLQEWAQRPWPDAHPRHKSDDVEALLSLLQDKERAQWAAEQLASWPNDDVNEALFAAYLQRNITLSSSLRERALAQLALLTPSEMNDLCHEKEAALQLFSLLSHAPESQRVACLPMLLGFFHHEDTSIAQRAKDTIRTVSSELVFSEIEARVSSGEWELLALLRGPIIETQARRVILAKYQGKPRVSDWLRFIPCPLREPTQIRQEQDRLSHLQERRHLPPPKVLTREELFGIATSVDDDAAKKAMTALAANPDEKIIALLSGLATSPTTKIRLHAYRLLRTLDKPAYLAASYRLLDDPLFDVQRSAIRALTFARDVSSLPKIVSMLHHSHQAVLLAVQEGLLYNAEAALPAVKKAMKDARPDKREVFQRVLDKLEARQDV